MKKQIWLVLIIALLLFLSSCQKYIGTLEVRKGMNKIGIANPVINLRFTEYSKPSGNIILNKTKVLRSVPKEMLIVSEKELLNNLITKSISICEENLTSKFVTIESAQLKSDFKDVIDEENVKAIHSNGFIKREDIFSKLPNKTDKLLTYVIMSDVKTNSLKPKIDDKSGEHKLVIKKATYDNFNIIKDTKEEKLLKFNNYNYMYTLNNQSSIDENDKSKVIETCSKNNLDALIFINFNYQFERTPDVLSLDYKWRIRLRGEIKIFDKKGFLINENALTGKSNYLKITKSKFNKISSTTQFVYNTDSSESEKTIDIFEVVPRSEYSFSLQNIFGSLFIEATEDFLIKLESLD